MIILGIDPGFAITGYGVIEQQGSKFKYITHGAITTEAGMEFSKRLEITHKELDAIIKKYKPDLFSIEELFFAKNTKTGINVAQSRGVIILTALQNKLPIYEFTPLQIKQAITGYGRADKNQIQQMVKLLLNLKEIPKPDDAADALAIAITCANTNKNFLK